MIGYLKSTKFSLENRNMDNAFDVIQLKEPHEAGETINNHWLILSTEISTGNGYGNDDGKYKKGYYVKVVNLNFVRSFITDIDYSNRIDFKLINKEVMPQWGNEYIEVNTYEYIS